MDSASQEHAGAVRARLDFPVWHSAFTKTYTAWANAPSDLKTPLLLQGQALAKAESWLLTCPDRLSESQKRFIVRSISHRAKSGGELPEPAAEVQSAKRGKWHRSSDRGLWTLYAVIGFGLWLFSPDIIREVLERALQAPEAYRENRSEPAATAQTTIKSAAPEEAGNKEIATTEQATLDDVDETPAHHEPPPLKVSPAARLADIARERFDAGKSRPALLLAIESAEEALAQSPSDAATASRAADLISRAMATREVLGPLASRSATAISTLFCQDGRTLVAITAGESLTAWTGTARRIVAADRSETETLAGGSMDRDCRRLLLPNEDFNVEVRSIAGGNVIAELRGHEGPILASSFSPDSSAIVTASQDSTARIWDARTGRLRATLSGHNWHVTGAEFSPDGRRVLTASADMTARIWDAANGRQIAVLGSHQGVVTSAHFSSDGARVLTTSWDSVTRLWDAATGRLLRALQQPDGILLAELSPDGRLVATSSADGSIRLWDSNSGAPIHVLPGNGIGLRKMLFTSDGLWLVTHAWNGRVDVIDVATGKFARTLTSEGQMVRDIELGAQARTLVAVTEDGVRLVWPLIHSAEEAISMGKEAALPCLDANERASLGLESPPPAWCAQSKSRGASLN